MAKTSEEWELSKENIQPLQQGRKHEILKVALTMQPDDAILQQRQAFEQELRTYSGKDPLSVWCKYIKWVEQIFPKGGRDGHIEQLLQKCLFILKDEKKYLDDNRFIEIWLKFAVVTTKPVNVYDYMYSNNIGCKSANFYIAWAWELEQQGNINRANQVLTEGLQRKAEPYERMKSHFSEFEMRIATKVLANPQQGNDPLENGRSAFSVLKPQKKNMAPVVRTGEAVCESSRNGGGTFGRQQPLPRSNIPSTKVPFRIYNAENIAHPLPVKSENAAPFILYSDLNKENEKKPSKWNKARAKQTNICPSVEEVKLDFPVHHDGAPQPSFTPRSIPKVSDVLKERKDCRNPAMALFESPDPKKKPMYDRNKVYGGAQELSLEEIRAAAWHKEKEKNNKEKQIIDKELILLEQQKYIKNLQQQVELLKNDHISVANKPSGSQENIETSLPKMPNKNVGTSNHPNNFKKDHPIEVPKSLVLSDVKGTEKSRTEKCFTQVLPDNVKNNFIKEHLDEMILKPVAPSGRKVTTETGTNIIGINLCPSNALDNVGSNGSLNKSILQKEPSSNIKLTTTYNEAELMIRDLYDGTLFNPTENLKNIECMQYKESKLSQNIAYDANYLPPSDQNDNKNSENPILHPYPVKPCPLTTNVQKEPFTFYHDGTENIPKSNLFKITSQQPAVDIYSDGTENIPKSNFFEMPNFASQQPKIDFYCDGTENIPKSNLFEIPNPSHQPVTNFCRNQDNVFLPDEDRENIPPMGYVQEIINRELAGVLEPSKNVPYVPLELQEELEEQDGDEDLEDEYIYNNNYPLQDETIIPPCNTEVFLKAAFLHPTSTPRTQVKKQKKLNLPVDTPSEQDHKQQQSSKISSDNHNAMPEQVTLCNVASHQPTAEGITDGKQISSANSKMGTRDQSILAAFQGQLSMIMESSRENYKSSSSSGSSAGASTLHKRLEEINAPSYMFKSFMNERAAGERCSSGQLGTLTDFVNHYKTRAATIPEDIIMYLTSEMLYMVAKLHECHIIHGDVKPDNILLCEDILRINVSNCFTEKKAVIKFIEFNQAIDLKSFKEGVSFEKVLPINCPEMMENKPWVFQPDWYGLLNCIHLLLFSEFMKVKKNVNGTWGIEKRFKRFWDKNIWAPLFDELLNIPACYQEPDIKKYTGKIESKLKENMKSFQIHIQQLTNLYPQCNQ